MKRRTLSDEEKDLWTQVARSISRAETHIRAEKMARIFAAKNPPVTKPLPEPAQPRAPKNLLEAFRLGEKARAPKSKPWEPTTPAEHLAQAPVQMDAKKHTQMTRGKLDPEARIDLHGMTLAEAHPELIRFILNAQTAGLRLVLVITGKGKQTPDHGPIPQRMGVLRHQVPHWLHMAPLGPAVLQVREAHLKHGGGGAYYVYLRKR